MNPAAVAIGVGVAALALLRGKARATGHIEDGDELDADAVKAEADRIVRESREIVQGKRDAYSDAPDEKVTPRDAAERTKEVLDKVKQATATTTTAAEDALAIEAARKAAEEEARRAVTGNQGTTSPVVVKPPAPKPPAPKPPAPKPPAPKPPAPAPTPVHTAKGPPAGYDAVKAKNASEGLAKHIGAKQYNYERKALQAWQKVAGIAQDGVYGPTSANALKFYTPKAPKKLFAKAKDGTPYPNTPYPPPEWSR